MNVNFKERKKTLIVLFNGGQMVNPKRVDVSYPIPAKITNQMQLQNFLPDLNKLIDERSRKQALIMA